MTTTETLVAIWIVICLAYLALQPHFESQAYNRLTGAHTTYWDAVWLDLRVQSSPK